MYVHTILEEEGDHLMMAAPFLQLNAVWTHLGGTKAV